MLTPPKGYKKRTVTTHKLLTKLKSINEEIRGEGIWYAGRLSPKNSSYTVNIPVREMVDGMAMAAQDQIRVIDTSIARSQKRRQELQDFIDKEHPQLRRMEKAVRSGNTVEVLLHLDNWREAPEHLVCIDKGTPSEIKAKKAADVKRQKAKALKKKAALDKKKKALEKQLAALEQDIEGVVIPYTEEAK